MAATATAMIRVANQPITFRFDLITKRPMMSGRAAINIMTIMMGTEMIPLITALQYSALIGSIAVKFNMMPINVEMAMTP
jgi:hypothetical protein